jgi:hypothetical protein
MMKRLMQSKFIWRVGVPGSALLAMNGCGLSDAQLASIWQSVLTTAFSTMVTQFITNLFHATNGTT